MELIGAGLSHHVHVCARIPTVARVICRRLDLELLDRVRIGNRDACVETRVNCHVIAGRIVDRNTIHLKIVLFRIRSIHAHVDRAFPKGHAIGDIDRHTRSHSQHGRKVPGRQGQRRDGVSRYRCPDRRGRGLNRFRNRLDRDFFTGGSDFQCLVEYNRVRDG